MMVWVVAAAALGGGIPAFSKMALTVLSPFTFLFFRFVCAAAVLIPLFIRAKETIAKSDRIPLVLISLLGTGNVVFFAFGVRGTTAVSAQILYGAVPVIALTASVIALRAPLTIRSLAGVAAGLAGVVIIVFSPQMENTGPASVSGALFGNVLVFFAVVSYSLYTVASKKAQNRYSPLLLTTIMVLTTLVLQSGLALTEAKSFQRMAASINSSSVIGVVYVGVAGTAMYVLLYQHVIKKADPVVASMTFYLQPVFSYIWAFFLLGEGLTLSLIAGAVLAFIGAGLVTRKKDVKQNA